MQRIILIFICLLFVMNNRAQTVTDYDGNVYSVIVIGSQAWLKENLKTTHYRNGVVIPHIPGGANWASLTSGARCYYDNDSSSYDSVYGVLYNWFTVNNSNGLCPEGWHVPTDGEWTVAENFLGGSGIAGGAMKEAGTLHWLSPNAGATNSSGFTGLPGGMLSTTYAFQYIRENGLWWTSTLQPPAYAWGRYFYYMNTGVERDPVPKTIALSIRCIRDPGVGLNESGHSGVRIYPNPVKKYLSVNLAPYTKASFSVHDISGKSRLTGMVSNSANGLDLEGLAPGIYLITLTGDSWTVTEKISKE